MEPKPKKITQNKKSNGIITPKNPQIKRDKKGRRIKNLRKWMKGRSTKNMKRFLRAQRNKARERFNKSMRIVYGENK